MTAVMDGRGSSGSLRDATTAATLDHAGRLARIRERDFPALDRDGIAYLDHTGAALPSLTQIDRHHRFLVEATCGNPHSSHRPSLRSTAVLESAREATLRFLNADPDEYTVVFTANASHAIRLVGESFGFRPGSRFVHLADNHNSVLGVREYARAGGAETTTVELDADLRVPDHRVLDALAGVRAPSLFAYPAQSNFSGVQHPLEWIADARERGWQVLLDAAAYLPVTDLDLSRWSPDFVPLSYYKLFGWPTGIGALVARTESLERLRRPWFAGGTVIAASASEHWHAPAGGAERFEDGTPDFLGLAGVPIGLDYLTGTLGRTAVREHVTRLTTATLRYMAALTHDDGSPLCTVHGPVDGTARGATIAFTLRDRDGRLVDERLAEREAVAAGIALRAGCFCNPGVGEEVFGLTRESLRAAGAVSAGAGSSDELMRVMGMPIGGALRVSFGAVTNDRDIATFLRYLRRWRNVRVTPDDVAGLDARTHC